MGESPNVNSGDFTQPLCNQRLVSFQPGAVNGSTGMPVGNMNNSDVDMNNSDVVNDMMRTGVATNNDMMNSASNMVPPRVLLDLEKKQRNDSSLSVYWSHQEVAILRDGLARHASETSVMKYIKIATTLPNKTVRDVAMRCQWMMDSSAGSSLTIHKFPNLPESNTPYSLMMLNSSQSNHISCKATAVDAAVFSLFEENYRFLSQIAANLEMCQIQSNVDLFARTRRNITAILQSTSRMADTMSQMPPLPLSMNEDLFLFMWTNSTMIQSNVDLFARTRRNITAILQSMSGMADTMSQMPLLPLSMNEDLFLFMWTNSTMLSYAVVSPSDAKC